MSDIYSRVADSYRSAQMTRVGEASDTGLESGPIPSKGGFGTRQSKISPLRDATAVRHVVRFLLPETGLVSLYINPQSFKFSDKKLINETRTRNGFNIQYFGEDLGTISIQGTTGTSGIEGINVLSDIYRNEQVSMDPLALALTAYREQQAALSYSDGLNGVAGGLNTLLQSASDEIFKQVNDVVEYGMINPSKPRPTLASMATSVEMYWQGAVYRGYFTDFSVDESAQKLGLFDYNMTFKVTQKRGLRLNFLPWHKSATLGQSNSDPAFGIPYSFGSLRDQIPQPSQNTGVNNNQVRKMDSLLISGRKL